MDPGDPRGGRNRARRPAHGVLFPAAAAYAAIVLPLSVAALLGVVPPLPGLATPAGHAHEMLFGFALAVVAGNQLGPLPPARLAVVVLAWSLARIAFLAAPGSLAAGFFNAGFAILVAAHLLPRVAASVRKWRNRALPATVVALCGVAVAMQPAVRRAAVAPQETTLLAGVLLLALLMLFMGGRIIAPAAAGQFQREGRDLSARVQPRLEGALVVAMALAVGTLLAGERRACAVFVASSSALAAVRLARWHPWALRARHDLAGMSVGYAWLVAGLAALAAALLGAFPPVAAIHVVTIGALGTLTINVMALTWARLARRDPARIAWTPIATLLVAAAAAGRLAAVFDPAHRSAALALAAGCWSGAFLVLLGGFATMPQGAVRRAN